MAMESYTQPFNKKACQPHIHILLFISYRELEDGCTGISAVYFKNHIRRALEAVFGEVCFLCF